ncbi:ubiquitin-protein ligase peroxin 10 KNAG_0J01560 [Huiozyma naganishii CBS 8797]|uniref:RING-type E3 ubiquitin transferase n=1 Tax=Huiozyma naganishii (strain ATCC MYA-139 / BCRC 22969 / CBS 8797 / KCTC 17520 / NBRC 10181 / NCYC 3082 / Yp74L-3) TaxID=1071383 RepID=J7S2U0_HUIN7|nr:hypothetical protein KNAG_0J01560 [Kazachstania naganishii CBS 8797]CCK72237.1 hypothetical protein KNAG_0J01560 [Kazachstania naganishii CBS 8797]
MECSMTGTHALPFADAASIVQSRQKDEQIEDILIKKFTNVLQALKGQLFTNMHPTGIARATKFIYLLITTLRGVSTLGEEYVDILYVNRSGRGLPKRYSRLLFILSTFLGPYALAKLTKRLRKGDDEGNMNLTSVFDGMIDFLLQFHLMTFYVKGSYYNVFKRIFGLRYAIGHKVDSAEGKMREQNAHTYKILGYVVLIQSVSKGIPIIKELLKTRHKSEPQINENGVLTEKPQTTISKISLRDPEVMPFISGPSRDCTLCLLPMTNPSCAPCGHTYCWDCLFKWCNERPECPLCRQTCAPQQILMLRQ